MNNHNSHESRLSLPPKAIASIIIITSQQGDNNEKGIGSGLRHPPIPT